MSETTKNVHDGHRKRLMDTVLKVGLDKVSEVQAIEFILTYIFPRGDVNEIAHALIKKFGNVTEIINADWKELMAVSGMGERSAKKLHSMSTLFNYFAEASLDEKYTFEFKSDIGDYFEELLKFKATEMLYIIGIDPASRVKTKLRLHIGNLDGDKFDAREVAKFITAFKPAYLFLAHNHPTTLAEPTTDDLKVFHKAYEISADLGTSLIDYVIVGADGVYGTKNKEFYRKFKN